MSPDGVMPGDMLLALVPMRAWVEPGRKGTSGLTIGPGQAALVLETWLEGGQRRMSVLHVNRVLLFSCPDHAVARNWKLVREG